MASGCGFHSTCAETGPFLRGSSVRPPAPWGSQPRGAGVRRRTRQGAEGEALQVARPRPRDMARVQAALGLGRGGTRGPGPHAGHVPSLGLWSFTDTAGEGHEVQGQETREGREGSA